MDFKTFVGRHMYAEACSDDLFVLKNIRSGDTLGEVHWYPRWKQYVLQADDMAVFSADCLRSIALFMSKLKAGA